MRKLRILSSVEAAICWLILISALFSFYEADLLCLAAKTRLSSPPTTFRIDNKTKIKDIFKCSGIHFIGSFNEYYVACELKVPAQENITLLEVVNVKLDVSTLSPLPGVHVELTFQLNTSLATVSMRNSQLQASAVEIHAANVLMDEHSTVNVSAHGLKFGPGYNSWTSMGGSYGGIGGASLTPTHRKCEDMPPNDFFRVVGDVSADSANFRGYGSGGGNDESRGGGRIRLIAQENVDINGSLLANGGDACTDCYDSAGAGGSIIVAAKERIHGNATVQANGGEPSNFNDHEFTGGGGGGGGGGGRIVLDSMNAEELGPARVEAYGGGLSSDNNAAIGWCQLGGDGTILKLQHSTKDDGALDGSEESERVLYNSKTLVSTLLVKGGRLAHLGPVKRIQIYGCTPIFEETSRGARFLPESLVHVFVRGGATVCASVIQLKDSVGGIESSIVLDSGSELNVLGRERKILLSASQLTLQGYVGPSSPQEHDLFDLTLIGADVSFSNALTMVHELEVDAHGALSLDKFSELKFQAQVSIQTEASTKIEGFLQPLGKPLDSVDRPDGIPLISVTSKKDVELRPQTVEMGQVELRVKASGTCFLDMPFDTPFLRLSISAANVSISNVNSGPVLECNEIELQADASACKSLQDSTHDDQSYSISVFASEVATLGNISAGSMILCSDHNMTVEGAISSSWLGCGSGIGPGKSEVSGEASGGAGHGGRGGNVLPGSTGGGAAYDISKELVMQQAASWIEPMSVEKGWPIWPGSGAASGDTPNKVSGGSGGGIIYIGSKKLNVTKSASILARGGAGSMGGGGGSGGSLTLFIANIAGGGTIDLAGGAASTPALIFTDVEVANRTPIWDPNLHPGEVKDDAGKLGGGGGGGIVRITYVDSADKAIAGNGEEFIKDGGRISVDGGESTGGENGGTGVMVGANCHPGRGGVFCLPCPEGSHSPGRFSKCSPCEPGTCSGNSGAEKCDACPVGHFNPDFGKKECQSCPLGSFGAKVGLKKCKLCPPGSFAGVTGSSTCSACPIGSITTSSGNRNCTLCGIGETTIKDGAIACATCKNKPVHSAFNMRGSCSYACFKGRNGLDCLTPFERLVKPIGGPIGFVILVFAVTGLIFGAWGFFSYRSSKSELHRYAQYKAQRLRDELSLETLTRTLTARLTDQDLNAHVARLYLAGDNHLKNAWRLNPYFLPASLRDIVEEGTYATFASTCNKMVEWDPTSWEAWLYRFLLVTIPPISTFFMRRRQLHRVVKLSKYIGRYGGRFFRDVNFRVHGTQLKVGFSPDFSLGYFDVLISQSSSATSVNLVAMQAVSLEDLVLVVGGSGSFFRPYHLDTNDIIVRAIPSRLELLEHNFWIDFVADINQMCAVEAARVVIAFVEAFNETHVKDGFAVAFGTFSVGGAIAADANDSCFEPFTLENIDTTIALYPQEPFKLAFRVSRLNSKEVSHSRRESLDSGSDFPELPSEESDKVRAETDPRSANFRYSQIRMEALFAQPERRLLGNYADNSSDNSDSLTPLKKPRIGGARARAFVEFLCTNDTAKRWLATLWQPVYPLFRLRNLSRPKLPARWLLSVLMVLLLIADMGVVFWIMVEYYCVQIRDPTAQDPGCSRVRAIAATPLWSVLGVLPAAIVGSPMLGLIFVTKKSIFYGKLFAVWNVSSIVNQMVAFICGLAFLAYIHDEILLVAVGGVLIKFFEKEVALRCIAQYASERPFRGWRGLHTTRDWYDAAYTPLVHHEN
ncbi:uncharacterized protein PITG_06256 [Phytophthora infestans T30-4]|uniref:Tyrosine-protein kinase ephrin type A/B receptor-like domain-containing protein n=1 Tax=Phytophthora infestans (strain T30-4) TaxID=403677 RepID=D0N4F8_PHYIT|nr:uncharacterized protein PITG_06256 [Phytophthora infestans T30-4]EEY69766.1 conserved hypothetical protein [Phytophthora infestans T30-4]|eukprot:XP_002998413.1 conserved hypothetical protein [Phytophthora infestans T30-4]